MKVILNQDIENIGEIGDIKDVKSGFFRNYLFPRKLAILFNAKNKLAFETRKAEIDSIKAAKRQNSLSLKERIEAQDITISAAVGPGGKLFGAVSAIQIVEALGKKGIEVERRKIDIPNKLIKNIGNYKVAVRLYEKDEAILKISVVNQEVKTEEVAEDIVKTKKKHKESSQTNSNKEK